MRLASVLLITLASCGNKSTGSELVGQVKKVVDVTPLICDDYTLADVSLGVVRNGVGSMSHEDVEVVVRDADAPRLREAARTGRLVKIVYDERRVAVCWPDRRETSVELLP